MRCLAVLPSLAALLLAACAATPDPGPRQPATVRILHLPDLRVAVPARSPDRHRLFTDLLTTWSTTRRPHLAFFTGNSFATAKGARENLDEFLAQAGSLPCPWYAVAGDFEKASAPGAVTRETFLDALRIKPWLEEERAYHEATPLPGFRVINLDTARPGERRGAIDGPQQEWLERTLAGAHPDDVVIVHTFHPLLAPEGSEALVPEAAGAVRRLLARHPNVKLVLQGLPARAWEGRDGGIPYVCSPGPLDGPRRYRLIEVSDGALDIGFETSPGEP